MATMTPRLGLTKPTDADGADAAAHIGGNMQKIDDQVATVLELQGHTDRTDNPHLVTAEQIGALKKGSGNQSVSELQALILPIDTRSWVATAWNANGLPTHIEIKDGMTVVATIDRTYDASDHLLQQVVAAGGKTVTYTVTWNGDKYTGHSKVVT